eukprot:2806779-Pleurochrysis_carterae.AAC.1
MGVQTEAKWLAQSAPVCARLRASTRRGLRPDVLCHAAAYILARPRFARRNQRHAHAKMGLRGLQGELQSGEVVYCHAPPGYATLGADGRPR